MISPPPPRSPDDHHTAAWILEFVLRQPSVPDWMANEVLHALPLTPSLVSPRLKKTILLRRLATDLSRRSLSEQRTLHSLELIHDLYHPSPPSVSMKAAYGSVALHCAASSLRSGGPALYSEAVDRIWNRRLADLERSDAVELVSDWLKEARAAMEDAVGSDDVMADLLDTDTEELAVKAVGAYLKEATEALGPSFLELAAATIGSDSGRTGLEGDMERLLQSPDGEAAGGEDAPGQEIDHLLPGVRSMTEHDPIPDAVTLAFEVLTGRFTRTHQDRSPVEGDASNRAAEEAAEVGHAESSGNSTEQDRDDVVQKSYSQADSMASDSKELDVNQYQFVARTVGNAANASHREGNDTGVECQKDLLLPRPSLMDRNPTAQTYEWGDDSIDSPSENSPSPSKKVRLPRPKRSDVSTLKLLQNKTFKRRRKAKKWSLLEEDTLRQAVERFGIGSWKAIRSYYSEIFDDRTEGDLKDKWRNMTRH